MSNFVQQIIKKKFKQITTEEILTYSKQYQIPLTKKQAVDIISFLNQTNLNPLDESDRMKMFKKLAQITDLQTAQRAQRLFHQLIKEYGVESWFK